VQLYKALRDAVLSGQLAPGDALPSSRQMAIDLGISRSTVLECYQQLIIEGYVETRAGSKTIVSERLPQHEAEHTQEVAWAVDETLSNLGKRVAGRDFIEDLPDEHEITFHPWRTDYSELPVEEWARILWRVTRQPSLHLLDYALDRAGSPELVRAIAEEVAPSRGITTSADEVITVLGWQQALDIVLRAFIDAGDYVAVENPSFFGNTESLTINGARVIAIPVDEHGMIVDELVKRQERIKLIFLMPSHQFPTGAVLSLPRRLQLLEWARAHKCLIVEDDFDSEHCYDSHPQPALKTLDEHDCVVYIETFTKILYPSFGLGYIIAPKRFAHVFREMRRMICDPPSLQAQQALAEFIGEGHLLRHRRHMRPIYQEKRDVLIEAVNKHLRGVATIYGEHAGLHVFVRLQTKLSDAEIIRRCTERGVGITSAAPYYLKHAPGGEFVLGYACLTPAQIKQGIKHLASAIKP
jgi:GntR family transcriptional regulator/MocR family aminotransferase